MKIIYFKNDQCNVCKTVLEKAKILSNENEIELEIVDVTEHPEVAGQMLVFTVPTIILVHENNEIKRFARNFSIPEIEDTIERYKKLIS
ncbi:thioredoxin [candidate division TA06 bacterium]|uniref:Thioredoxin n=1 Tax=candidate division TA06 bacterium TaxID=2250710 RepID=A0A660S5W5_UNCT6|nr:MAG: thioredoxin [candidate division TA06 bacterium]